MQGKKRADRQLPLKRRDSLQLLDGRGQEDNKSMHRAMHYWRFIKLYSILLWEGDVMRITMWGQSLESKSAEAQRLKTQSPAEGPDSKEGQSPVPSNQRLQIIESQILSSNPTRIQRGKSPVLNMERRFCLDKPDKWEVSTRNQKVDAPYEVKKADSLSKASAWF